MLHILGLILRILGIVLICILAVVICLLCVFLFVPVRYEITADFPGNLKLTKAGFRLTWLLHLLSVRCDYDEQTFVWGIRIGWKKYPKKEESEPEAKAERTDERESGERKQAISDIEQKNIESKSEPQKDREIRRKDDGKSTIQQQPDKSHLKRKKEKPVSLYECVKEKILSIWKKITYTFTVICDKIKNISDNLSEIKETIYAFLNDEVHRSAFAKIKKEFVWIKRLLKPKIFHVHLCYGFEDPYLTGQTLAFLSMVYPFVGDNMEIEPKFEEKIIKGDVHIKGRIRMIYMVVWGVKLFVYKDTRKTFIEIMHMIMR